MKKLLGLILLLTISQATANDFHQSMRATGESQTWQVTSINKTAPVAEEFEDLSQLEIGSTIVLQADTDVPLNVSYYSTRDYYSFILNGNYSVVPDPASPLMLGETAGYGNGTMAHYDVGYGLPFLYPLTFRISGMEWSLTEYFQNRLNTSQFDSVEINETTITAVRDGRYTTVVDRETGIVLSHEYTSHFFGTGAPNFSISYKLVQSVDEQNNDNSATSLPMMILPIILTLPLLSTIYQRKK